LITKPPDPPVVPVAIAPRPADARWLLAWLTDAEATPILLGRPAQPTDDLAGVQSQINVARAARAAREPWQQQDPIVAGDAEVRGCLQARLDVQACFSGMIWQPAYVDLRRVLAVQKNVNVAGQAERINKAPSLVDLCLPTAQQPELRFSQDGDGKGMTLSSPDLNLKVAGAGLGMVEVAPGVMRPAVQIVIDFPMSFVNVGLFRGRYYLRDGYHRAAGLLRAGKHIVPCIVVEVDSVQQLLPNPVGLFSEDVLLDDRPPALTDFWDESVACAGNRPSLRIVRVRGDEIVH
jgi:hypothetical protein